MPFPIKVIVEYRPRGECVDYAPVIVTNEPEAAADEIVRTKGWDRLNGYKSEDVWVDGAI